MEIGDTVRVIDGYFKNEVGFIEDILELEVFEDVIMVDLGDIIMSFSEKELELIK